MTTEIKAELITLLEHPQDALQRGLEVRRDRRLGAIGVAGDEGFENLDMPAQRSQRARRRDEPVEADQRDIIFQPRSEEHTSELQPLMRISYAVFSLKKNKTLLKLNQQV